MGLLLEGKVIAVIGGNGLIGRETVASIVDHGGKVVVASRSEEGISEILEKLSAEKRKRVVIATVDVNSSLSTDTLFEEIIQNHGQCHGIVNLAFPRNAEFGTKFEEGTYTSIL